MLCGGDVSQRRPTRRRGSYAGKVDHYIPDWREETRDMLDVVRERHHVKGWQREGGKTGGYFYPVFEVVLTTDIEGSSLATKRVRLRLLSWMGWMCACMQGERKWWKRDLTDFGGSTPSQGDVFLPILQASSWQVSAQRQDQEWPTESIIEAGNE